MAQLIRRERTHHLHAMKEVFLLVLACLANNTDAFVLHPHRRCLTPASPLFATDDPSYPKNDNKAMSFLRKIGKVGTVTDFTNIIGVDEGPADKSGGPKPLVKSRASYTSCVESGIIDDMTETFPLTSAGTTWSGFTDRVMGGMSSGSIVREMDVEGRVANVLTGTVSLANNGGFVQMATDLSNNPAASRTVDGSAYDGIELDIRFEGFLEKDQFNIQ
jgi:Complex I intermediate-associated protein 30 (CIA30)